MIEIKNDLLNFQFLETGDLYKSKINDKNINLIAGNYIDGALSNIYLRIEEDNKFYTVALLGKASNSKFMTNTKNVKWVGTFKNVDYEVIFKLEQNIFYYKVLLKGNKKCQLFYCNDLSLGYEGNEAYIGQYIDHRYVYENKSYTVLSRQNQPQNDKYPYIQLGCMEKIQSFSTDAFQFYGKEYKVTNKIKALEENTLENKVYQYEFPFIALQTETIQLNGFYESTFYGYVLEDSQANNSTILDYDKIKQYSIFNMNEEWELQEPIQFKLDINNVLNCSEYSFQDLKKLYPNMDFEEFNNNNLISFFSDEKHIVLKEKEELVERQHGNIIISANEEIISENLISSTSYMSGIFNSHIVVGNTKMNIFLSYIRNPLNLNKINGQRIFIKIGSEYKLLNQPSLFEMGLNYCKWVYLIDDDTLTIINSTKLNDPIIELSIESQNNKHYDFIITNLLAMGTDEFGSLGEIHVAPNKYSFDFDKNCYTHSKYPNLKYFVDIVGANSEFFSDEIFYEDGKSRIDNLKCITINNSSKFKVYISGSVDGEKISTDVFNFDNDCIDYKNYFKTLLNGFELFREDKTDLELEKFNKTVYWYAHNALVHYSMPHGLEQYSSAAWGTRDVCQGPFEFFLCTQNYSECKKLLKKLYSYQIYEDGNWSQWFMFDKYQELQLGESHGDVIVWPLKALSSYILATNDYSILDEKIPYVVKGEKYEFTKDEFSILDHVEKQLDYILENFYGDTCLSKYGGGDWDDTLQPYKKELADRMVSGWTTSLTYEVFDNLVKLFKNIDSSKAEKIENIKLKLLKDYNDLIIKDDVVAGFIYFDENNNIRHILHPSDKDTNIKYRLLPITRSIISKLFTKDQAQSHLKIIEDNLYYSDGVRLMSTPPTYKGGIHDYFVRAESATNFGREIGLNYIHADIRYAEAMSVIGKNKETIKTLLKINPIKIQDVVKNAELRQSNCYFSSSDGEFATRYEAQEYFYKLRCADINVKGGWRIYSSGPGIYINQLLSNILGVRFEENDLIIDSVLPSHYDGVSFRYKIYEKNVIFKYMISNGEKPISDILLDDKPLHFERLDNPYRVGGIKIKENDIRSVLKDNSVFKIIIS